MPPRLGLAASPVDRLRLGSIKPHGTCYAARPRRALPASGEKVANGCTDDPAGARPGDDRCGGARPGSGGPFIATQPKRLLGVRRAFDHDRPDAASIMRDQLARAQPGTVILDSRSMEFEHGLTRRSSEATGYRRGSRRCEAELLGEKILAGAVQSLPVVAPLEPPSAGYSCQMSWSCTGSFTTKRRRGSTSCPRSHGPIAIKRAAIAMPRSKRHRDRFGGRERPAGGFQALSSRRGSHR